MFNKKSNLNTNELISQIRQNKKTIISNSTMVNNKANPLIIDVIEDQFKLLEELERRGKLN